MGAGEGWKRKREAMGKSLEDVARELHISQRYLRNIEDGAFEAWPERVFSTGFIRAYAKMISEDPGPVLSEYYGHIAGESVQGGGFPVPQRPAWLEQERRRGTRMTTYAAAAAAVFVVGLVLAWISWHRAPKAPPAPVARTQPLPRPAAAPENAAASPAVQAPLGSSADNGAGAPPAAQTPVLTVGGGGGVQGPYQLFIEASLQTWMRYAVDGGEPVEVMLYPGDRVNIQAQKRVTIKLGNAGGVAATLNGRLLAPFGAPGQVKEVTLGE